MRQLRSEVGAESRRPRIFFACPAAEVVCIWVLIGVTVEGGVCFAMHEMWYCALCCACATEAVEPRKGLMRTFCWTTGAWGARGARQRGRHGEG